MKKIAVLVLVMCLIAIGGRLSSEAYRAMIPQSFERVSEDGSAILRYRGWDYENDRYLLSVYRNYGDMQLIYTIEDIWLSSLGNSFSDDMMYFVHSEYRDRGNEIIFFAYGEVVGRVARSEFIEDYSSIDERFMNRPWLIGWRMLKLDSDALEFTIRTCEGRAIVFDMTNGEIILDTTDELEFEADAESNRQLLPRSFSRISVDGTAILYYRGWDAVDNRYSLTVYSIEMEEIYTIKDIELYLDSYFSDDMMHFVYNACWRGELVFYAHGEVVGRVARSEFIEDYYSFEELKMTTPWIINWRMINLDSYTLEFAIETDEGRTIVFDMTNGEIILDTTDEVVFEERETNISINSTEDTNNKLIYAIIAGVVVIVIISAVIISLKITKRGKTT